MPNFKVLTEGIPEGLPINSMVIGEGPPPETLENIGELAINQEGEK